MCTEKDNEELIEALVKAAGAAFDKARGNLSGDGYANPFIMFRLGECCLEIGDEKNAARICNFA